MSRWSVPFVPVSSPVSATPMTWFVPVNPRSVAPPSQTDSTLARSAFRAMSSIGTLSRNRSIQWTSGHEATSLTAAAVRTARTPRPAASSTVQPSSAAIFCATAAAAPFSKRRMSKRAESAAAPSAGAGEAAGRRFDCPPAAGTAASAGSSEAS